TTFDYQVTQGEMRQARVRVPAGHRLLRVEGESIRTWELKTEGGAEVLLVDLLKGVSPSYRLTVETEKVLEKLPAQARIDIPHALDVQRETGLLAVRGGEELSLSVETAAELQRVDAAEFARVSGQKADGIFSAWRFLKPEFQLTLRAEMVQPRIEAIVLNQIRVGFEQTTILAQVEYTVKQAGIFNLKLALPAGYRLESLTGPNIQQWTENKETRVADVALKERTSGTFRVTAYLVSSQMGLLPAMDLAGVHPLGVHKLAGFIGVATETGVAVKATTFSGVTEVPASTVVLGKPIQAGSSGGVVGGLAYKYLVSESVPETQPWKLAVATETMESWVRAEVVNVLSTSETLVTGRALVRYDIQNAPLKEFRLRVPAHLKNVEITGHNIRRRDQNGEEWRVELQNKVRGNFMLTVTWEEPRESKTNQLAVAGVSTIGAERETGSITILAKPPLQVEERGASSELIRIDARELPAWAGISAVAARPGAEVPVLSYRYLRPGWTLTADIKRFDDAAVLQALVEGAALITVVSDDGQMMTQMTLSVRNNGRQHLEIELPAKSEVWSAFVAGMPVRPGKRGDKVVLPLEQAGGGDAAINIELTYVGAEKFPRRKGAVNLVSPKLDVPLKNAQWELFLPPDYQYEDFGGSMTHTPGEAPQVKVFSQTEYAEQEMRNRELAEVERKNFFSNAKVQLQAGKVAELNEALSQARSGRARYKDADRDLERLEEDLKKAQVGNLVQAQRDYTLENAAKFGVNLNAPAQQAANNYFNYDAEAAGRQWDVLQRAQELTMTTVQPLHVNLPTRGLRHSFAQVLQTEINKPMTISFSAQNTKEPGWFSRVLTAVAAFVVLWSAVATLLGRRQTENATPAAA
ncbi:MAG: hypothetical protein AB1705_23415, partial [Verrucomicrobiota bacterium]